MFIAQLPQIPSRQLLRKVNVGSTSFLILISASNIIGPVLFRSSVYVCIRGFEVGSSGFHRYMWKVFVFESGVAVGSSIVLVLDGETGDLEAVVSMVDWGMDSTAVAYDREARRGLNIGRAEWRSRELHRRAAIVADVSRSGLQSISCVCTLCRQSHSSVEVLWCSWDVVASKRNGEVMKMEMPLPPSATLGRSCRPIRIRRLLMGVNYVLPPGLAIVIDVRA